MIRNTGSTTLTGQTAVQQVLDLVLQYASKVSTEHPYNRWLTRGNGRYDIYGEFLRNNGQKATVSIEVKAIGPRSGSANNKIAYFPYDIRCQVEDVNDAADISICVCVPWDELMEVPNSTKDLIASGKRKAQQLTTPQNEIAVLYFNELEAYLESI